MTARVDRRHYSKAPIVEALIDIQIESESPISIDDIAMVADSLKTDFPTRLPLHVMEMGFTLAPDGESEFSNQKQLLGLRLDKVGRVLQIRTNGLTYSHLPPYTDWPKFSGEAQRYWEIYNNALNPVRAKRVAVRMINRIPLPAGDFQLDSCLNLYPTIPSTLPPDLQSLAMQLQLPMKHIDDASIAILQLYPAPPTTDGRAIMLDIDFIIQRAIPINDVFSTLNVLGDAKDDIFEACITDTTRDLIS